MTKMTTPDKTYDQWAELPLIYVAGPYTVEDPVVNTNNAIQLANELLMSGLCVPHVPHQNIVFHLVCPHPYHVWLGLDVNVLDRCDALLWDSEWLPGESKGATLEVEFAEKRGIPVYRHAPDLIKALREGELTRRRCAE
jgi:hypothetical protein